MFHYKRYWVTGFLAGILLVVTGTSFAQLPTGTMLGVVKDSTGGVVAGAEITIQSTETGQTRLTTTGDDGAYRVPGLAVGGYTLKVERSGFKTATQRLTLEVGQQLVANFTLDVGSSTQEVTVTSEAPLVNTTTSSLGGLVSEDKMSDLPLNGRNFIDLSLMQAGITQNKAEMSNIGNAGVFYSSNGAPIRSNNVTLDGAMMVNQYGGASGSQAGTTLGVDGIREYRVVTSTFSAEYGMTMGSQVVIVSKNGTNQFHGDVFEYLRNSSLDARNFFDTPFGSGGKRLPQFQRNNFGGSFGGPIKKDKTFFHAVYEGFRQNLGFTALDTVLPAACHTANNIVDSTCDPALTAGQTEPVAPVMQPLLALFPSPSAGLANNRYTFPTTSTSTVNYGQIRVDHNFSGSDSLFGRFTIQDGAVNNANTSIAATSIGIAWPNFRISGASREQFLTLSENHVFSPALLNTGRISFVRTGFHDQNIYVTPLLGPQYSFVAGQPLGAISISGFTAFGPNTTYGPPAIYSIQNIFTVSDDLFYSRGKHGLKFGVLINRFTDPLQVGVSTTGRISFLNIHQFVTGVPLNWSALAPGSNTNRYYTYNTFGFYAQDDFRVNSRLTLNLGTRYEFRTTPREANGREYVFRNILTDASTTHGPILKNSSLHNFSPRLGFAYDATGKGKTSIRGAFGMLYDVNSNIGPVIFWNTYGTPPLSSNQSVINTTNATLTLPLSFPSNRANAGQTNQYDAAQTYTLQYNLTLEQQLPGQIGISVSYAGLRGVHVWTGAEGNPTPPSSITNGVPFWAASLVSCENVIPSCRTNTNYNNFTFINSNADSWYNGLQVNLNKRFGHGLQFQAAYTFSKVLDTTQNAFGSLDCADGFQNAAWANYPQDTRTYDKGPACFDATQNLRFNLLYHFPNVKSTGFLSKFANGWWVGNIVSVQSGYPFTVNTTNDRSRASVLGGGSSTYRLSLGTSATTVTEGNGLAYNFVPFDPGKVITGDPNHWFNPLMFQLPTLGFVGNSPRGNLRTPGLGDWDFSLVKDTAFHALGEKGNVEFRAEFFNFLNRANFGYPLGTVFSGALTDVGPYSEAPVGATAANPLGSAGQITTTSTSSRQVQLSLKVTF